MINTGINETLIIKHYYINTNEMAFKHNLIQYRYKKIF